MEGSKSIYPIGVELFSLGYFDFLFKFGIPPVQEEGVQFTIKHDHDFICLKTPHLRFLEVTNFLAPGFSYDKFLMG